jgi:CelD/BcsL family acetyltransferase involved in cellulose biosynthesis
MHRAAPAVEIGPVGNFASLGAAWRALEARADGSFFQSWAWTGCLVEERFPDARLLTARRGETIVALALFNRRPASFPRFRPTLLLGETGLRAADSIFIEHNGLLLDRLAPADLAAQCWTALAAHGSRRARWVLSGVPASTRDTVAGMRQIRETARRPAPFVDLSQTPDLSVSVLESLSANTRQQLRRSLRACAALGPLTLDIAASPDDARSYLDALGELHQRYWMGRGRPGAFAEPFFSRFHQTLLGRAGPGQSIDLLRVSAGNRVLGYLCNFVHRGWVAAYQSGFSYGPDADALRPGLMCHLLAIDHYRRRGMRVYDFLGGEARYKRSFANAEQDLYWLEARPPGALF